MHLYISDVYIDAPNKEPIATDPNTRLKSGYEFKKTN